MWRLPRMHHEIVGIAITDSLIHCGWVQPYRKNCPYILKAYRSTPLPIGTILASGIFNPTFLQRTIQSFLQTYRLHDAYIFIALGGSGILHDFISLASSQPIPPMHTQLLWDMQYLYPEDNNRATFYQAGLSREQLTQYILLAIQLNLNLLGITPFFMPYKALYHRLYGAAFRRAQLASDMKKHNNHLELVFTQENLRRLIFASSTTLAPQELALMLGLFILGNHEAH